MRPAASERGNAVVEFLAAVFLLIVPTTYLILTFFAIQGAAFAAEGAARDAGRILMAARNEAKGKEAASYAAASTFADFGVSTVGAPNLQISCSARPCLTPGATITVTVTSQVTLPLIPLPVAEMMGAAVQVEGRAVVVVDRFVER